MNKYTIIIILSILVFLDQLSKILIKLNMSIGEEIIIFDWFKIHFIENNGMAFGIELGGKIGKLLLTLFRIVAIVLISVWLNKIMKIKSSKMLIISLLLILSGAIGNILDSIFYGILFSESEFGVIAQFLSQQGGYAPIFFGKVVDMLYFPLWEGFLPTWMPFFGGEYFVFFEPVFNLADSYVSVGIAIMLIDSFFVKGNKLKL